MKNPITRENIKNVSIKTTCHILGSVYFVAQATADLTKRAEGAIVHKIDPNIDAREVRKARELIYNAEVATIQLGVTIAKQKYIHAKHAVERKLDVMFNGPLPADEVVNDSEAMTAANAGVV